MINRPEQILKLLRSKGIYGLTVKECMEAGAGTELRRNCTTLIRLGHNITSKWKNIKGMRFKRYYLIEKQPVVLPQVEIKPTQPLQGFSLDKWRQTRELLSQ